MQYKIYQLLKLRRQLDRKILLGQTWGSVRLFKFWIKLLIQTKKVVNPFSLVFDEKSVYNKLSESIKITAEQEDLLLPIEPFKITSIYEGGFYQEWFEELAQFDLQLREYDAWLILQGSYADGAITEYSDVDLVIFYEPFNEKVLAIKQEIEEFLLSIDPLQHHGVFMIDKNTFKYYWQMDLPIEVLRKAKCFAKKSETLNITSRIDENISSQQAVNSTLKIILDFCDSDINSIGVWRWKFFLSQIMLLPTLILGAQGTYIYKRESFEKMRSSFSDEAWFSMQLASEIRRNWQIKEIALEYKKKRKNVRENLFQEEVKIPSLTTSQAIDFEKFKSSLLMFREETQKILG